MLVGLSGKKGVEAFLPKGNVEMDIDYIEWVDNLGWKEKKETPTTTKRDINGTVENGEPSKTTTEYDSEQKSAETNLTDYDPGESSELVESNLTGDDLQESSENTKNNSTGQESSGSTENNSTQDADADSHPTTTKFRSLRTHLTNMLARYNYVLGQTPFKFYGLGGIYVTKMNLNAIRRERPAVFCLNDNLETAVYNTVMNMKRSVTDFLKAYFPNTLPYENRQPGWFWK